MWSKEQEGASCSKENAFASGADNTATTQELASQQPSQSLMGTIRGKS